jgi:hypothetical protein
VVAKEACPSWCRSGARSNPLSPSSTVFWRWRAGPGQRRHARADRGSHWKRRCCCAGYRCVHDAPHRSPRFAHKTDGRRDGYAGGAIEIDGDVPTVNNLSCRGSRVFSPEGLHGFIRHLLVQRPEPSIFRPYGECWRYCPAGQYGVIERGDDSTMLGVQVLLLHRGVSPKRH